ncbi:hypothetical protein [Streptomyces sp. NPDC048057]|uniref:hypothetical protein n=1 Tax=Streptomyces sp. NPDC048057 TaxID=3155628 RepID=UPI0033D1485B
MKGDRVEIVVDAGDSTRTYEVVASRAGRRVETAVRRGVVEVSEVTRTGAVVRTARFMATRVLALVEQPVPRDEVDPSREAPESKGAREPRDTRGTQPQKEPQGRGGTP